jgi:hypothetical protein
MPIRVHANEFPCGNTLPDLEPSFEQRLGGRRRRHFLPDGTIQQSGTFSQLQGSNESGEFTSG